MAPPTKVTFDFNDGDMVTTVDIAAGTAGGGWGVTRVEVFTRTPVRPESLRPFLDAMVEMILSSGVPELIALHDDEHGVGVGDVT